MRMLHKSTKMMKTPEFSVEWRSSNPFIIEKKPIELAAIRINGGPSLAGKPIGANTLKDCLLVHPRYVGKRIDHEIIKVRGWRNGRTIDILVDEPYMAEGKEFPILNFKGVGANSDRPMVIHPTGWYRRIASSSGYGVWASRKQDIFKRYFGASTRKAALSEMNEDVFVSTGIPSVVNLQVNPFPRSLNNKICAVEGSDARFPRLAQLVRPSQTNLRMANAVVLSDSELQSINASRFAEIDSQLILLQLKLAKEGRMIISEGDIITNRFIDGVFTDSENYAVRDYTKFLSVRFLANVVNSTLSLLSDSGIMPYLSELEKRTGIQFTAKKPGAQFDDNLGGHTWWHWYDLSLETITVKSQFMLVDLFQNATTRLYDAFSGIRA